MNKWITLGIGVGIGILVGILIAKTIKTEKLSTNTETWEWVDWQGVPRKILVKRRVKKNE